MSSREGTSRRLRTGRDADVDAYRLVDGRFFLFAHLKDERFAADDDLARSFTGALPGEEVLGVGRSLKTESRSTPLPAIWLAPPPEGGVLWTVEDGLRLRLETADVLNPGLFLDQRENRARLLALCGEARERGASDVSVLNLFSYTGAFSLSARRGSARTTSVDVSGRYLAWERASFEANFSGDPEPPRRIKADARDFLRRAKQRGDSHRFIVLDPPTFSRSDGKVFRVREHLPEMVEDALGCLSTERPSAVFVSTNDAGWGASEFLSTLQDLATRNGAAVVSGRTPDDFGPSHPLKSAWLERR